MNYHHSLTATTRARLARHAGIACTALLCWLTPQGVDATAPGKPPPGATVQTEFTALQERDARARQDMSRWLRETSAHDEHLAEKSPHTLSLRMEHRLATVEASYRAFLARHPNHAEATAAMEAFRRDLTDDLAFIYRWEEGRAEAPDSPTPWNALAHELLHTGRSLDAFACFEKALSLNLDEAIHYFDYATAMLLYRAEAMSHYKLTEQELFSRVLIFYRQGMHLEPENYRLAADYAQTFYVLKPARPATALTAWDHALKLATNETERGEARTHLARHAIHAGHLNLARVHLDQVTAPQLEPVKLSLLRRIDDASKARSSEPLATPKGGSE